MTIKDSLGEVLEVGDYVAIPTADMPLLVGKIVAINEGGILATGHGAAPTPTNVRVVVDLTFEGMPNRPIGNLVKAFHKPEERKVPLM